MVGFGLGRRVGSWLRHMVGSWLRHMVGSGFGLWHIVGLRLRMLWGLGICWVLYLCTSLEYDSCRKCFCCKILTLVD